MFTTILAYLVASALIAGLILGLCVLLIGLIVMYLVEDKELTIDTFAKDDYRGQYARLWEIPLGRRIKGVQIGKKQFILSWKRA